MQINTVKDYAKKIGSTILNWCKKEKLITFVLIVLLIKSVIYNIWQFSNELKYGKFSVFKPLPSNTSFIGSILQRPKTLGVSYYNPTAIKIDDSNAIFFVRNTNTKSYSVYNLDLKKKKFKKFTAEFNYPEIKFADRIGNKIVIVFSKNYNFENLDNTGYLVVYDYIKDVIENATEIKETWSYSVLPDGFQKVKINGTEYVMYGSLDTYSILKKPKKSYTENYCRKLFDVKTNTSKDFNVFGIDKKYDRFIGQTENGISLFYKKNDNGYLISAWDLDKKKKLSEYNLEIKEHEFNLFFIRNNKFMAASRQYDINNATIIDTFNVDNKGKITKISSLEIEDENGIIHSFRTFPYKNYIVLNPNTIIISKGYDGRGLFYHCSKKTYVLNYETNEIKRITDFKYAIQYPSFIKLDDNSFIMYGVMPAQSIDILHLKDMNKIYKFKLKEGV